MVDITLQRAGLLARCIRRAHPLENDYEQAVL
jgi:hypothetical protein